MDIEDDIAHVSWGGGWRMPTAQQMEELTKHCTWTYGELDGQKGYKVVGLNNKWIFLPEGGYCHGTQYRYIVSGDELLAGYTGGGPYYVPTKSNGCRYWTRTLYSSSMPYFLAGTGVSVMGGREDGLNVRPVCY